MENKSKLLNIFLWVLQVLLAGIMLMAAYMKLTMPVSRLAAIYPWTGQVSAVFVRLIGVVDGLGGLGLILPGLLRVKPVLTVWAAGGILSLMLCAIVFHVSRGEASVIGFNVGVVAVAGVIIWGR
jgi:hypothetical protein